MRRVHAIGIVALIPAFAALTHFAYDFAVQADHSIALNIPGLKEYSTGQDVGKIILLAMPEATCALGVSKSQEIKTMQCEFSRPKGANSESN